MTLEVLESLVRFARLALEREAKDCEDKTVLISCAGLFQPWKPDIYKVGDIRTKDGIPYECITPHDSVANPDWTVDNRTLWKSYHSKEKEWALPWVTPTGAHDIYKSGEYMIWIDSKTYKCKQDTNFSPADYPQAWEICE